MPDLREVFTMSTQKVKPDPGFVDRQHEHTRRHERRRKVGAFVVVGAIGLAIVVAIVTTRSTADPTIPAGESPSADAVQVGFTPFLLNLGSGAKSPLSEELGGGVLYAVSPDGSQIAYGDCCTSDDVVRIANIDGTDIQQATPQTNSYGPRWSPDGTEILFQVRDARTSQFGSLVVESITTGRQTELASIPGANGWWFMSPSFNPDGQNVIFHVPRGSSDSVVWDVWSVPATGGEPTRLLEDAAFARYFPNGKDIVFVSGMTSKFTGSGLSIASADGTRRTLVEANDEISRPAVSPDGSKVAYLDGTSIFVVDVATGSTDEVSAGTSVDWIDDDTLIIGP
jgi:Tol biopolymer transport system component